MVVLVLVLVDEAGRAVTMVTNVAPFVAEVDEEFAWKKIVYL